MKQLLDFAYQKKTSPENILLTINRDSGWEIGQNMSWKGVRQIALRGLVKHLRFPQNRIYSRKMTPEFSDKKTEAGSSLKTAYYLLFTVSYLTQLICFTP